MAIAGSLGADADSAWWWAAGVLTLINFSIGAPINVAAVDVLGFVVARPISPVIAVQLMNYFA
jgi:hypothetical protein